jgi:hypothetical protein
MLVEVQVSINAPRAAIWAVAAAESPHAKP